ncbi:MAG: hypothetical protein KDC67_09300 [Ignavibacteriae bacterium]|nr:hypothetical protein [Ignavibacteriota bacterium]
MEEDEILVFTSHALGTRGDDDEKYIEENSAKLNKLNAEIKKLQKSIAQLYKENSDIPDKGLYLDEITINAEINAEGKLGILGVGSSVGLSSGISLKFKRNI